MVGSRNVQDGVASEKLQQRHGPDTGCSVPQPDQEGSTPLVLPEKTSTALQRRQSPDSGVYASETDQEENSLAMIPVDVSQHLQPRQSSDSRKITSECDHEKSVLSVIPVEVVNNLQPGQVPDAGVHASQPHQEEFPLSAAPGEVSEALQLRQSPDIGGHSLKCDQNGSTLSIVPEKAPEDGYNWRKYGQKFVKGNEFTRSYYRCTHSNCPAKRQVERSHAGQITDTVYLGKHEHPKPQHGSQLSIGFVLPLQAKQTDESGLNIEEDKPSGTHFLTSHHIEPKGTPQISNITASDDVMESVLSESTTRGSAEHSVDPDSKKQKRDICNVDESPVDKPNAELRHVVHTMSGVDLVNDGYRWRKYGQKLVKGNANPRSYYRCTSPGCLVKKHVERASHDPRVVVTTYEGCHDHDMPPGRTVTVKEAAAGGPTANTSSALDSGSSVSKAEVSDAVGVDVVVGSC